MDTSFGNWIKRRRKALDFTQQELAQRVGCSASAIVKIEADERRPSRQVAELLAQYLEIPPEQLDLFLKIARHEKGSQNLDSVPPLSPPKLDSAPSQTPTTLPLPLTSIVGRDHEQRAIIQQIQDPACRLLTLTGPGGVGKTRLALEVAHQLRSSFDHGACFVSLVGTSTSEFIVPAIAEALGFVFSGTTELRAQLFSFLKKKRILLVLDNLEHLLSGIELLDQLLEQVPDIKLLATSREPLNLRAEWVFEVQGLPIPKNIELHDVTSNSSAALFIQRAKQAKTDFTLTSQNIPFLQRICQLVDGLPLGLELAATWVRMIPLNEVANEIEKNMNFLTTSARDVPQRHRSIRAVFDYSWRLLTDEEQLVMQKLSVFRSGFTRDAAKTVADANLQILSTLVSKSLVRHNETMRYDLHELIRQYAASHLQADAEQERAARKQHSSYYLTMLAASEYALRSERQVDTLARLKPEIDNLRIAWDFAVTSEDCELLRGASGALYYFYELHQFFHEAETLFRRAAEMAQNRLNGLGTSIPSSEKTRLEGTLADMQTRQAFFVQRMGRVREALDLYNTNLDRLKNLDEPFLTAYTYIFHGIVSLAIGNLEEARQKFVQGLPLTVSLKHPWLKTIGLCFLAETEHGQGNYNEAYTQFSEAMAICETMKDPYITLLIGTLFSRTAQMTGRMTKAEDLLHESLRIARESGNRWGIGLGLEQMAALAQTQGDLDKARLMLEESVSLHREVGDMWSLSRALNALSRLALSQFDLLKAEQTALDASISAMTGEYYSNALEALSTLAKVHACQGKSLPALELALFVQSYPASTQNAKEHAMSLRSELESQFTPQQIEVAQAYAQSISLEKVIQVFERR